MDGWLEGWKDGWMDGWIGWIRLHDCMRAAKSILTLGLWREVMTAGSVLLEAPNLARPKCPRPQNPKIPRSTLKALSPKARSLYIPVNAFKEAPSRIPGVVFASAPWVKGR